jgi:foldase protein PrsA
MTPRKLAPVLVVLALAGSGCARTFSAGAAVVNGVAISKAQVNAAVKEQGQSQAPGGGSTVDQQRQALSQLIAGELIRQAALKRKIAPSATQVQDQLQQIRSQFPDAATFEARLKENGLTEASLRRNIETVMTRQALVEALAAPITIEQISQVYNAQKDTYRQVSTKHILIAVDQKRTDAQAKALANDILLKLKAGASFAALAKKYSADPSSKDKGGAIGYIALASLDPAYAEAAQEAKIGALTGPVRSQFGWHVIVTLGKKTQPLSQVKDQLREQLQSQVADRTLQDFLQAQVVTANVEVNPRYGDWDPSSGQVVAHQGFVPASPPALDQNFPDGGLSLTPGQ